MDEPAKLSEDELWGMLAHTQGRDRADILIELAERAHERRDLDRALTLCGEAEATADDIGDQVLVARTQVLQASCSFGLGDYVHAAARYGAAAAGYADAGMAVGAASALVGQADSLRMSGDFAGELEAAMSSRTLAEAEDEPELAGSACHQQANALYFLDRERAALTACRDGRDHFRRAGRPDRVAAIDDFALTVRLYLGDLDEALELARGCVVLARTSSSERDDSYALRRLAETQLQRAEYEEALRGAEQARSLFRAADDLIGVALCDRLRADALVSLGREGESIDALVDARVIFDATGLDFEALQCDVRRALILRDFAEFTQAARINERLIEQFAALGDAHDEVRWSIVRLLDNLVEAEAFDECLKAAATHRAAWADVNLAESRSLRGYLALRATALAATGETAEASAIADEVIASTPSREAGRSTALAYEVRARDRLAADDAAGAQDLAHAIALHLAKGDIRRARELSQYFLPVDEHGATAKSAEMFDLGSDRSRA